MHSRLGAARVAADRGPGRPGMRRYRPGGQEAPVGPEVGMGWIWLRGFS